MKPNKVLITGSILFGFLLILTIFALVADAEKPDVDKLILLGKFETCQSLGFSPDGVTYRPKKSRLFISAAGAPELYCESVGVFEVTLEGELIKHIYFPTGFNGLGFSITRASSGPKNGHFFLVECYGEPEVRVVEFDSYFEMVNEFLFTGIKNPGDGIAFNHITKNLAILDGGYGIFEVTTSGELVQSFPTPCNTGITYNRQTGTYFGLEFKNSTKTLYEFTTSGEILRSFNLNQYGIGQPVGIGYGQGKLFIADETDFHNTGGYIWIFKSPHRIK